MAPSTKQSYSSATSEGRGLVYLRRSRLPFERRGDRASSNLPIVQGETCYELSDWTSNGMGSLIFWRSTSLMFQGKYGLMYGGALPPVAAHASNY